MNSYDKNEIDGSVRKKYGEKVSTLIKPSSN